MLPTINRALDKLLVGRFPYVNFPPPMPHLSGIFLAYAPTKILGIETLKPHFPRTDTRAR